MASRAWTPSSLAWRMAEPFNGAEELARRLATAPLVAQLLHNRGIDEPDRAKAFLNPQLTDLHDPLLLAGAEPAEAGPLFERLPGVAAVEHGGAVDGFHTYRLRLSAEDDVGAAVYEAVREKGWTLRELRRDDKTLEQVFRELRETGTEVAA